MKKTKRSLLAALVALTLVLSSCSNSAEVLVSQSGSPSSTETIQSVSQQTQVVTEDGDAAVQSVETETAATLTGFGSKSALTDQSLTLASMLTYAMQDEYMAHAEYVAILDQFGSQKPFSNIVGAEQTHISMLTPLFSEYGIALPADDAANRTILPASITEALETGVNAEIDNIAMYELFLKQELPADVKDAFTKLMNASQSHLAAFQSAQGK